jgi:LAO/AO transport system kinase
VLAYALVMATKPDSSSDLIQRAVAGEAGAVAELLAAVEAEHGPDSELMKQISVRGGNAHRIAILGAKGSGKSTLIVELARYAQTAGAKVGVVASERAPSAQEGARLGDRLRLDDLEFDEGIVVRSIAASDGPRAHAITTSFVADAFDALGFDPVLIEILGVKAPDLRQLRRGHSVVLVLTAAGPDAELLSESGLLALCDLVVINKADQEGASELAKALRAHLPVQRLSAGEWEIPTLLTTAYRSEGIGEVHDALARHVELLRAGGEFEARRRSQLSMQLEQLVEDALLARLHGDDSVAALLRDAAKEVASHELDLASAAERIARKLLDCD